MSRISKAFTTGLPVHVRTFLADGKDDLLRGRQGEQLTKPDWLRLVTTNRDVW